MNHPAYPSTTTLRRESRATHIERNATALADVIRTIIQNAINEINTLPLSDGYWLEDIPEQLAAIMPPSDMAACRRISDWATDRSAAA